MFKHYLASALRHFAKHKTTTVINVLSLSFGLACFAMAYGFVSYYKKSDLHHEKAARSFVVTQAAEYAGGVATLGQYPISSWGIGPQLKADYPDIEIVARAMPSQEVALASGDVKGFGQVTYADAEFLDVFDLPFVVGDRRAALKAPHSAVVNETFAKKLFGTTNVVGKSLLLNNRERVEITGVITESTLPSHISASSAIPLLNFDVLVSMDAGERMLTASILSFGGARHRFTANNSFTYVVLRDATTIERIRADLAQFSARHVPAEFGKVSLGLRPTSEIYASLGDAMVYSDRTGLSNATWTLTIGALVLIAACLNYANLASAQATTRLKELALRRIVGASRKQILLQSFFEALLLLVVAALLMIALLPIVTAGIRARFGIDFSSLLLGSWSFWSWIPLVLSSVALLACSYPALVSTQVRPAAALKSGHAPITKRRMMHFFVVAQFATASLMFIVTAVMIQQNERIRPEIALGEDPVVVIGNNLLEAGVSIEALKSELRGQPGIRDAGALDIAPGQLGRHTRGIVQANAEATSKHWLISAPLIDDHFFQSMGIDMIAGRALDPNNPSDLSPTTGVGNVVIDRKLATEYGWTNPEEAVGKQIYVSNSAAKDAVGHPRTVVGVAENKMLVPVVFVGSSSTMYALNPQAAPVPIIRLSKDAIDDGVRTIERVWNRIAPNIPLKRRFMDEQFEAAYRQMTSIMALLPVLAVFAALVGALGLTGIATHAMAQRTFEIGVRRTLGASVRSVLVMLLRDFSKPILIANLIAWPFAFVISKAWTSFFSDKAPVTLVPFVTCLLIGLVIAWLAVFRQASRAARMNPATVLRYE